MSTFTQSKPVVLSVSDWNTSAIKYMPPKVNEKGGKSINVISKQTSRSLHFTTPLMMTWGITDFIDDKGESDGKFSISLNFPNDEYKTPATTVFLDKLKAFENQILDDAVANSELWWGEQMSRELCKHTFFPFLKYSKNKDTKKIDYTKPPSIRAKVPCYNDKWAVELYDTNSNLIFPSEDPTQTPPDFVPKLSNIACVLQCGGIWIGGKGWGLTWKMVQGVVKPRVSDSVYGKCHINLSSEDKEALESQPAPVDEDAVEEEKKVVDTTAEDSDEEVEAAPAPTPAPSPAKKVVVKKAAEPAPAPAPVAAEEPAKKMVIKKKVVAAK
uniref:Uncharacterized protein n=1 Tax=viral metagenome TaxID=1070528 RepID=A0A6C0F0J8_9ZZZZ